ncbi:MAG: class I SAM-dependent methyltransferase [Patescibacteria group bacterium]
MKKGCPICGVSNLSLVFPANIGPAPFKRSYKISGTDYGKHLDILRCLSCGIVFQEIGFSRKAIDHYYQSLDDPQYEEERINRSLAFKRIIKSLKKIRAAGKLLDVGCATGAFLVEARNYGYEVYGIEPSNWAVKIAREKYHLKVKKGFLKNVKFPKESLQLVTLIDVLEHLVDPISSLRKVCSLLEQDGVICIVMPNINSLAARILGERWWHIRPGHFFYFSPKTIKFLLEMTGFEIIISRRYKWYLSASYFFQRLLKLLSIPCKIKFKGLEKITLGIDLGDSMEVYAVKK